MFQDYEEFTDEQKERLSRYVTSTSSHVFALKNLPEVIKGALFSRYSRSGLGLRSLLLKEFITNEETCFDEITGNKGESPKEEQTAAIKKAQAFYDRILDGYGDDSIGELGGAHLAIENISMLAAKTIESSRIGGSPLEKSTRYIYFDQKHQGEYLFLREPVLMTSAFREEYVETCNHLFDTYSRLIPPMTELMEKKFPKEPEVSKTAYTAALRAKVLDCLRGLLPASTLTNMGLFGNGRFFEVLLQKLQSHNLTEIQDIGRRGFRELSKVIPSFIRRAEAGHRHFKAFQTFQEEIDREVKGLASQYAPTPTFNKPGVQLIDYDRDGLYKVAAALLFPHTKAPLLEIQNHLKKIPVEGFEQILDAAACARENRRHKSPRALEQAFFTYEIVADFGIYRDLQRHRMLTERRQLLTCDLGYFIPDEILDTPMEKPYREAMDRAKEAYDRMAKDLPEEAQYVIPMAYNVQWYFHVNLRALQWLCELRSSPQGHPAYRLVAQTMAHLAFHALPESKRFFKFVDFEGYELGRLDQELRKEMKVKDFVI
ncbi:MAG: FAD-dependent thymidylate synthase [Verrucomicrobia bacterium]|nr:FAD-dependent thymidylate synthase [Verrucomicrobiota bacterium]